MVRALALHWWWHYSGGVHCTEWPLVVVFICCMLRCSLLQQLCLVSGRSCRPRELPLQHCPELSHARTWSSWPSINCLSKCKKVEDLRWRKIFMDCVIICVRNFTCWTACFLDPSLNLKGRNSATFSSSQTQVSRTWQNYLRKTCRRFYAGMLWLKVKTHLVGGQSLQMRPDCLHYVFCYTCPA